MFSPLIFLATIEDPGDNEKFISVYEEYCDRVYSIAYKHLEKHEDAEEATQNTFFSISKNLGKIDPSDKEKTSAYIYTSIRNACIDLIRRKNAQPNTVPIDSVPDIQDTVDIEKNIEVGEALRKTIQIIKEMDKVYSEVLLYYIVGNFSVRGIADMLHRPVSTVKSQLRRGKKILIQRMKEENIYE